MPQKPETAFKKKVQAALLTLDNIYFFKTQQVALLGIPDMIICVNGMFVALELKSKQGRASKIQEFNLNKINNAKGLGLVVYPDNWSKVFLALKALSKGGVYDRANLAAS
jgi:hypothetical protein